MAALLWHSVSIGWNLCRGAPAAPDRRLGCRASHSQKYSDTVSQPRTQQTQSTGDAPGVPATAAVHVAGQRLQRPVHRGSVQRQVLNLVEHCNSVSGLVRLLNSHRSLFTAAPLAAAAERLLQLHQGAGAPGEATPTARDLASQLAAAAADRLATCTAQQLLSILRCAAVLGAPLEPSMLQRLADHLVGGSLLADLNHLVAQHQLLRPQQRQQRQQRQQQQQQQQQHPHTSLQPSQQASLRPYHAISGEQPPRQRRAALQQQQQAPPSQTVSTGQHSTYRSGVSPPRDAGLTADQQRTNTARVATPEATDPAAAAALPLPLQHNAVPFQHGAPLDAPWQQEQQPQLPQQQQQRPDSTQQQHQLDQQVHRQQEQGVHPSNQLGAVAPSTASVVVYRLGRPPFVLPGSWPAAGSQQVAARQLPEPGAAASEQLSSSASTNAAHSASSSIHVRAAAGAPAAPGALTQMLHSSSSSSSSSSVAAGQLLSQTAWSLARLGFRDAGCWSELASVIATHLQHLSAYDAVLVMHALGWVRHYNQQLFNALQRHLQPQVHLLGPGPLTAVLLASAAASHYNQAFLTAVAAQATSCMERFSPQQLSRSMWACARLRFADVRMLSALCVQAMACLSESSPASIARMAWGLSALKVQEPKLMAAIVSRASGAGLQFNMQNLALLAWSLAKQEQLAQQLTAETPAAAGSAHGGKGQRAVAVVKGLLRARQQLLQGLCTAAVPQMASATPHSVCGLLWACAVLQCHHQPLLQAAALQLQLLEHECRPLDVAQAIWAFAKLGYRHQPAVEALLRAASCQLPAFSIQALGMLAWGASSLGLPHGQAHALGDALEQQARVLLPQLAPRDLSQLLWAISELGWRPYQLLHATAVALPRVLQQALTPQDLCNIAVAAKRAGFHEVQLLEPLAAAAAARVAQFGPQGLCNMLWVYAACRCRHEQLLAVFSQRVAQLLLEQRRGGGLAHQEGQPVGEYGQHHHHHHHMLQQEEALLGCRTVASICQSLAQLQYPAPGLYAAIEAHQSVTADVDVGAPAAEGRSPQWQGSRSGHQLLPSLHLDHWAPDALALLVWSLTASGQHQQHLPLLLSALERLEKQRLQGVGMLHRAQLHMAMMRLQLEGVLEVAPAGGGGGGDSWTAATSTAVRSPVGTLHPSAMAGAAHQNSASSSRQLPAGSQQRLWGAPQPARSPKRSWPVVCPQAAMLCYASWLGARRAQHLGCAQEQVVATLCQMQLSPQVQNWLAGQQLRVEVEVEYKGRAVAVDVVPHQQYTCPPERKVMGSAALQQACWRLLGYWVAVVCVVDWQQLQSDMERRAFLLRALDTAVSGTV